MRCYLHRCFIKKNLKLDLKIVGLEVDRAMIECAKKNAKNFGLIKILFVFWGM